MVVVILRCGRRQYRADQRRRDARENADEGDVAGVEVEGERRREGARRVDAVDQIPADVHAGCGDGG